MKWQMDESMPPLPPVAPVTAGPQGTSPRRRATRFLLALLALVALAAAGAWYWSHQSDTKLEAVKAEVRQAAELEEEARKAGDVELYQSVQDKSRRQRLPELPPEALKQMAVPLPGVRIAEDGGQVTQVELDLAGARGSLVTSATVTVRYAVTDGVGSETGHLAEHRHFVRRDDGTWAHAAPAILHHREVAVHRAGMLEGRFFTHADAASLPILMDHVAATLERYCQALPCDSLPTEAIPIRFSGVDRGGYLEVLDEGEPGIPLPSPELSLAPDDQEGFNIWERAVTERVITYVWRIPVDATIPVSPTLADRWRLLGYPLLRHWLAAQRVVQQPYVDAGVDLEGLTLADFWDPALLGTAPTRAINPDILSEAAEALIIRVVQEAGDEAIPALLKSLPDAPSPEAWLAPVVGEKAGGLIREAARAQGRR